MEIWSIFFASSRRSDRVYFGWFVWDLVGRLFRISIGSSLSTGFQVYLSKCWDPCESRLYAWHDLFPFVVFLPFFSMFILSLPLLGMGSKSTSYPGFCVHRSRQYDANYWKLNLISCFFAFFWLIVWVDGINKCGWCLAGGRAS